MIRLPSGANSGGSGGGGAPSGAAGGELAGTYPNPTVKDAVIDDANIVAGGLTTAALAAAAGITSGQLAGSIAPSKITGTAVTAADTGTVTSAMITDGTIVTGDLNATAGITSGQLAGSIAPSKITGTAITAADTGSVTSTMILDATILNADVNASAAVAVSKLAAGTVGQRLVSAGSSATPKWVAGAGAQASMMPTGVLAESFPRSGSGGANLASSLTTQVVRMTAIELIEGMVISNLLIAIGTTAPSSTTHMWMALCDSSRVQLATTTDDTAAATAGGSTGNWPVSTLHSMPVVTIASGASGTFTTTYTGLHYIAICNVGTVMTLAGQAAGGNFFQGFAPILGGTSESLNSAAPAFAKTYSSLTALGTTPYVAVS